MPTLKVEVPHESRGQFEDQVENLEQTWTDDTLAYSFSTFGFQIKGTLDVQDATVVVTTGLPLPAMMMKGQIERTIREKLQEALGG